MSAGQGKSTTHVSFVCQKCSQPVKLNRTLDPKSLLELAKDVESKLSLEWSGEEETARQSSDRRESSAADPHTAEAIAADDKTPPLPRSSPQTRTRHRVKSSVETLSVIYDSLPPLSETGAAGSRQDSKSTLKQIQIASETFKLLSSVSDVDHPLCTDCPEAVIEAYREEIVEEEEAKHRYKQMSARLEQEVTEYKIQMPELDRELEQLQQEEEKLKEKLRNTERKRSEIAAELERQRERERRLKEEEQTYWENFNEYQRQVLQFREEQRSVDYQLQYMTEQLERLKKTNVLNSAFHIWHNGHFGTINGLRLGRLQTVPVEWSEINAALGQAALLLVTLARNAGATFVRYKVVPYGNQTFVDVIEGKKKSQHLPLYSSAGLRIFADSKFDLGLVAYLDCLNQLKQHIEISSGSRFALPYSISKDRIGNGKEFYSVKTQFNTLEGWTKALKFVLTNLRWALTYISANSMQPE
ncbi:Beclin-1 [Geodia barretti]|uniref:Beclin-1 n=1 Tax=Geodia barretti TaxID=519541 RepID=A0AA35SCK9_GEOBA|nr:Beclin-1 [Geodia barretti]